MQTSHQKLPNSRLRYVAELSTLEVNEYYETAAKRLASAVKITGFRPGKAPLNLVREQLKPESLREEAYTLAVQGCWQNITKDLTSGPIHDPEVAVGEFNENSVAKIEFEFDIRPTVEVKKWQTIKPKSVKQEPVTDKQVDEVIESLQKANAQTIVTIEPAKQGDKVEVTFTGELNGQKQEKLSSKHFPLVIGENTVIPGFAEQLIGLKKNDQKKFTLTFPADHFDKELAGQKIVFEAMVEEVYTIILPKATDELAKKFGHTTLPELKVAIKEDLERQQEEELFTQKKAAWLAEFEKCVEAEVPESLVKAEIERARSSWQEFLSSRHLKADDWLARHETSLEEMEKGWRTAATSSVKIGLGLAKVATEQKKTLENNDDYQKFLDDLVKVTISKTKK